MKTIAIAGCGALGSHIVHFIASENIKQMLYDNDRVEEHNVITGTSMYSHGDIGSMKIDALVLSIYTRYKFRTHAGYYKLVRKHIVFKEADLIVDCFDNVEARACTIGDIPVVHIGVSPQMIGAVTWDDDYALPSPSDDENEVCTHEVGRNVILQTAVGASVAIREYLNTEKKTSMVFNDKAERIL